HPVLPKAPQALAQDIVEFAFPLAGQKLDDLLASHDVLVAVAPLRVHGVSQADFFGVTGVPGIFGGLHLLPCGLEGEWWERWAALGHVMFLRPPHCRDSVHRQVSYRAGMDFAMSAKAQDYHKRLTAFMT